MVPDPRGTTGRLAGPRSLFGRVLAALFTLGAIVAGVMFSAVVLVTAVVVGLAIWGWLWWKMRRVLKQVREDPAYQQFRDAAGAGPPPAADGRVIEGEVIHEEWKDERRKQR